MRKPQKSPPKPAPAPPSGPPFVATHPASVPGPAFTLPACAPARAPTPPHSAYLAIARTPGGFVLLDPDNADGDVIRLTPLDAVAVAGTPADLAAQVTAWATATPPAPAGEAA